MNKNIILGTAGIVLLAGAFAFGYGYKGRAMNAEIQKYEQVRRVLDGQSKTTIGGEVVAVGQNELTIRTIDPFSQETTERKVAITEATVFLKQGFKTKEEQAADLKAYRESLARATSVASVPTPVIVKDVNIGFSDIKTGDFVAVSAESAIGDKTRLEAIRVTVETPRPSVQ